MSGHGWACTTDLGDDPGDRDAAVPSPRRDPGGRSVLHRQPGPGGPGTRRGPAGRAAERFDPSRRPLHRVAAAYWSAAVVRLRRQRNRRLHLDRIRYRGPTEPGSRRGYHDRKPGRTLCDQHHGPDRPSLLVCRPGDARRRPADRRQEPPNPDRECRPRRRPGDRAGLARGSPDCGHGLPMAPGNASP